MFSSWEWGAPAPHMGWLIIIHWQIFGWLAHKSYALSGLLVAL
jgi:hypothetical protein